MISRFIGIAWLAAGALSLIGTSGAFAQAISRQVTLVVPYSAGGGTDTVARPDAPEGGIIPVGQRFR